MLPVLHYSQRQQVLVNPYQELVNTVTEFVEHNADMAVEVKPVQHTNAVTIHTNTQKQICQLLKPK